MLSETQVWSKLVVCLEKEDWTESKIQVKVNAREIFLNCFFIHNIFLFKQYLYSVNIFVFCFILKLSHPDEK